MQNTFKTIFTLIWACTFLSTTAQNISDFENTITLPDTFLNGSDNSKGFFENHVYLPNSYNQNWFSWNGWSISSMTDTITQGWGNEFSAIAGSGAAGSNSYAVAYESINGLILSYSEEGDSLLEMDITNSTYAYYSMLLGDNFAKQFGGQSGTEPDFFKVLFSGYDVNNEFTGTVEFYLADYTGTDDYIIKDWTTIDLRSLGKIRNLFIELQSSDTSTWGINTPNYFCVDNIKVKKSNPGTPDFDVHCKKIEKSIAQYEHDITSMTLNYFINVRDSFSTITILSHSTSGTDSLNFYDLHYTSDAGFMGKDSIQYSICGVFGGCDTNWIVYNVEAPLGILSNSKSTFNVYPNPSRGSVNISNVDEAVSVQAFNAIGQEIKFQKIGNRITFSNSEKGLILLNIKTENQSIIERIILQ